MMKKFKLPPLVSLLLTSFYLTSCKVAVFDTKGPIAEQQKDLIFTSVWLMLIVVIPVIILTLFFAYKYRESNKSAKYTPDYDQNHTIEVIWWTVPIIIVTILAVITWNSSHSLDPYKPLESKEKPIEIQVVALDWKWLFIYPEQGIASVNFIQFPVNIPINFKITAQAPMNSFWIPQLAGQIYAMEGMQTLLHLSADHPGSYEGLSSNFSGVGFNGMKFIAKATTQSEFDGWVESVKKGSERLSKERYDQLAKPSSDEKVQTFSSVEEGLFMAIMMRYMMPASCPLHHKQ